MTTSPWSAEWSAEERAAWEDRVTPVDPGASESWAESEDWTAPEDWAASENWAGSEDWAAPDEWTGAQGWAASEAWTGEDELSGLDEGHALGEDELEAPVWEAGTDEVPTGMQVLSELLAAETGSPGLITRLTGLAALAAGPPLRRGSTGPAVAALQRILTDLGSPLAADGDFGARTDRAVRAFQARAGLTSHGVVDPPTKAALTAALARRTTPPGPSPAPPTPRPAPVPAGPGVNGPGVNWSRVPAAQRMRYVMGLLVRRYGYPVNGAAGIVGNLWVESHVIPSRLEGSRPDTPMRAPDGTGKYVDFTPEDVVHRGSGRGPKRPGVGLAQWTWRPRRAGLFRHSFQGRVLGAAILFDMDAQVDYLVHELRRDYRPVDAVLRRPDVTVDDACDEVLYHFEGPASVRGPDRKLLPRSHPRVQDVFAERRAHARRALEAYRAGA